MTEMRELDRGEMAAVEGGSVAVVVGVVTVIAVWWTVMRLAE